MKVKKFFFILILNSCASPISDENQKIEPVNKHEVQYVKQDVQYMIITHSSYANLDLDTVLKPNAALLIENKNEIEKAQELFLPKREAYHFCGYHHEVLFWVNSDSLYHKIYLNKECEWFSFKPKESQELLNYYAKLLETNPTHYIYNIEILLSFMAEYVKKELRDKGFLVFSFEQDSKRFPRATFSFRNTRYAGGNSSKREWEIAEQENRTESNKLIMDIVEKIKAVSNIKNIPEIYYDSYGRAGNNMTHRGTVELIFETKKDLALALDILKQTQAVIGEVTIPETYNLQLISKTSEIEIVRQKLKQYEFIKNVYQYFEE